VVQYEEPSEEYVPEAQLAHVRPSPYLPASQLVHFVSLVVVQVEAIFWPALQTLHGVHPAAAAAEKDVPVTHSEHSVAPPGEKVPAAQLSMPARLPRGFLPAGADLQELAPSTSEYSPSPVHGVQASVTPRDAVPAMQITAAVLSALVL
jgi:hypothetical protein